MRVPGRPGSLLAFSLLATATLAVPVSAQLEPLGRERRIDAGVNPPACPAAAALPDGTYLVAWSTGQSEGSFTCRPRGAVHARRLDRDGRPLGAAVVMGRSATRCIDGLQLGFPTAAGIAVSWRESEGKFGARRVVAKSLGAGGTADLLALPGFGVTHLRSGAMLVYTLPQAEGDQGLLARRFTPAGTPAGPAFQVLPAGGESAFDPAGFAAAEVAPGVVAAVWQTDSAALSGRRLRTGGQPVGDGFDVPSFLAERPLVAGDGRGRFVVAWSQQSPALLDVFAQVFRQDRALAPPFHVNTRPDGAQVPTAVHLTVGGEVAVAWGSERFATEGSNVVARLFRPDGRGDGPALALQTVRGGEQRCAALAEGAGDRWLAVWAGDGPAGAGVYARPLVER
ncbi:MAG TPA: hypothetical protein VEG34_09990 [Thermoanaerobaculia bacterium]|nr:hypothetical protein [Thermoanaerobaculia bacterium]